VLAVNARTADLTENAAFFRVLLSDTLAWRERLVERFIFGSGNHVRVTSSYQCEIPPDLATAFLPSNGEGIDRIKALVPVTSRPKEPLLGFSLGGPDGSPAHLLRRADIAALQAGYIMEAVSTSLAGDALAAGISDELVEAICAFTPGLYDRIRQDQQHQGCRRCRAMATAEYLTYGLDLAVSPDDVGPLMAHCDRAGRLLAGVLDEPVNHSSSSECVLLALPLMEDPPTTIEAVQQTVERYVTAIYAAEERQDLTVLQALADYGRRWELVAEIELPLGEPWTIKTAEDRPLRWARGSSTQTLAIGDAQSAHFEITVADPSIALRDGHHHITTLHGEVLSFGDIEDIRETSESMSIYTSQEGRGVYYSTLEVSFGRPGYVRFAIWMVLGLVSLAVLLATVVDGSSLEEKLAVITVPTTFAATLLLVREGTTLAARLDRTLRGVLVVGTLVLWSVVAVRLLLDGTVV
jgi:hypothetical protein